MTNNAKSQSGQGYRPEGLSSGPSDPVDWVVGLLVPVDHVEVAVRVLYNLPGRVGRYQVEVTNPVTKELLALRARPFHEGLSARETAEEAHKWTCQALEAVTNPDPF